MFLGEVNFILFLFFFIMSSILVNINTSIHLLLTAEFLWITLYSLVLVMGFIYDNVNMLSLTFFFLILSAVEFGIGLVIILLQSIFNRSINLHDRSNNISKFSLRFLNKISVNSYKYI